MFWQGERMEHGFSRPMGRRTWHTVHMPPRSILTAACLLGASLVGAPLSAAPPATSPVPAPRPLTAPVPAAKPAVRPTAAPVATPAPKPTAAKPAAPKPAARPAKPKAPAYGVMALKPGEFTWTPDVVPAGPVVLVVSLPQQRVHVYRNGVRIAVSTISSGRRGYETAPGVFPIIERQAEHYSNKYDNAPMPFMLRLSYDGTALHAGHLPGYPASHGCVRLPLAFAEQLFGTVRRGTVVVVADAKMPAEITAPGWLTPVVVATGATRDPADDALATLWAPERAPEGPLTAVVGTRDGRMVVMRGGIEIGHAPVQIVGEPWVGTRAYALRADPATTPATPLSPSTPVPAAPAPVVAPPAVAASDAPGPLPIAPLPVPPPPVLRWQAIPMVTAAVPSVAATRPATPTAKPAPAPVVEPDPISTGRLRIDPAFALLLHQTLVAGTTVIVTDDPLRRTTPEPPATPAAPAMPKTPPAVTPVTPPITNPPKSA
jgi:lipoprotein-anchoring transpeptidase ErfK/SrfK